MPISLLSLFFGINSFATTPLPCNGSPDLCNKRYDQVVYATTHNSTAVSLDRHPVFFIPNQEKGVDHQLQDGIRAFMIDAWIYNGVEQRRHKGEVWTCHEYCDLGGQPMLGVLQGMKKFLDENPREVVTIIFESYVSSADMTVQFAESGLLKYVLALPAPSLNSTWPTLGQMIQNNQRLVVLTDKPDNGPDWYMNVWDYAVETPYSFDKVEDFTCNFNRGKPENPLYIVNHFVTKALFRRAFARKANQFPRIIARGRQCFEEKRKIPNYFTIDFYRTSNITEAVRALNASLSIKQD